MQSRRAGATASKVIVGSGQGRSKPPRVEVQPGSVTTCVRRQGVEQVTLRASGAYLEQAESVSSSERTPLTRCWLELLPLTWHTARPSPLPGTMRPEISAQPCYLLAVQPDRSQLVDDRVRSALAHLLRSPSLFRAELGSNRLAHEAGQSWQQAKAQVPDSSAGAMDCGLVLQLESPVRVPSQERHGLTTGAVGWLRCRTHAGYSSHRVSAQPTLLQVRSRGKLSNLANDQVLANKTQHS